MHECMINNDILYAIKRAFYCVQGHPKRRVTNFSGNARIYIDFSW